ncbi:MAG: VWA domain-containing protein [Pirellulaceae bacterium]|nr:VWA domain-containing protein [Pirellulaceae bacterium]
MTTDLLDDLPAAPAWWRIAPAWLLSLVVHLAIAVAAGLWLRTAPPRGLLSDQDRPATIVLAQRRDAGTTYFTDESPAESSAAPASGASAAAAQTGDDPLATDTAPPAAGGVSLPQLPGVLASGDGLVAVVQPGTGQGRPRILPGVGDAEILAADALIPREAIPTGPTAMLSLFDSAAAEGRSFVFVIDRSQSMGSDGLGAIAAAAQELTAELGRLTAEQKFQVVAYNTSAIYFDRRELLPADEGTRKSLVRFVADLAAYGPTEHERGLLAALRLRPEVIFLLTDGGDPHLNPGQLRVIREAAGGRTSIHALHFGRGSAPEGEEFLRRLATENRGSYVYIDMAKR